MNVDLGSFHGTNRHSHSLRRNQRIWASNQNNYITKTYISDTEHRGLVITAPQILQGSDPERSGDARAPERCRRWLWRTSQHPDESEGRTRRPEHLRQNHCVNHAFIHRLAFAWSLHPKYKCQTLYCIRKIQCFCSIFKICCTDIYSTVHHSKTVLLLLS